MMTNKYTVILTSQRLWFHEEDLIWEGIPSGTPYCASNNSNYLTQTPLYSE